MKKLPFILAAVATVYSIGVLVLASLTAAADGECNSLSVESGCSCPGHSITYICAVADDGLQDGTSTVWKVEGVPEIIILHSQDFVNSSGSGSSEHVFGRGLSKTDTCYVSSLTIAISTNFLDKSIMCSFDNGTETVIGLTTLSRPTGYADKITNLRRINITEDSDELVVTWDRLEIAECPLIEYNVIANGCGSCEQRLSENVTKCTNVERGQTCTLSVYTDICDNRTRSDPLTVTIKPPGVGTSSSNTLSVGGIIGIIIGAIGLIVVIATSIIVPVLVISWKRKGHRIHGKSVVQTAVLDVEVPGQNGEQNVHEMEGLAQGQLNEEQNGHGMEGLAQVQNREQNGHEMEGLAQVQNGEQNGHEMEGLAQVQNGEQNGHGMKGLEQNRNKLIMKGNTQCETGNEMKCLERRGKQIFQRSFKRYCSLEESISVPLEAKVGESTTVTFMPNDSATHTVSGKLRFESEETDCSVEHIADYYQITFQPTKKGQHLLHIKVDDIEYTGSPFEITVIPPIAKRFTHDQIRTIENVQKPTGVAFNQEGNVIVVEELAQAVSTFNTNLVKIHSFGSPAADPKIKRTSLNKPRGVALNERDDIIVVDGERNCMAVFTSEKGYKTCKRIGGKGIGKLQFNDPMGIGINPNNKKIYVTDYGNNRIQVLNSDLTFHRIFGYEGSGFGEFKQPWGVAFDCDGLVFITDSGNHRIQVFEGDGTFIRPFGSHGDGDGELSFPSSIAIDKDGYVYVTEDGNHRISIFKTNGDFVASFGTKGKQQGQFDLPHGIAIDKDGLNLYVSDHNNHRILVY